MWQVETTSIYKKCVKKQGIDKRTLEFINSWAKTAELQPTDASKPVRKHELFQIWKVRIPNIGSNKGKRGGYRLTCFLVFSQQTLYLESIDSRKSLGGKHENPKLQQNYEEYLDSLYNQLCKELSELS